jgi:hypothetical protein
VDLPRRAFVAGEPSAGHLAIAALADTVWGNRSRTVLDIAGERLVASKRASSHTGTGGGPAPCGMAGQSQSAQRHPPPASADDDDAVDLIERQLDRGAGLALQSAT